MNITSQPEASSATLGRVLASSSRFRRALQKLMTLPLDAAGLQLPQWLLLCHLCSRDSDTLTNAASSIGHDAGALSRALRVLADSGMVTVSRDTEDRRSIQISVSNEGRVICEQLGYSAHAAMDIHLEQCVVDLLADLTRLLAMVRASDRSRPTGHAPTTNY